MYKKLTAVNSIDKEFCMSVFICLLNGSCCGLRNSLQRGKNYYDSGTI